MNFRTNRRGTLTNEQFSYKSIVPLRVDAQPYALSIDDLHFFLLYKSI